MKKTAQIGVLLVFVLAAIGAATADEPEGGNYPIGGTTPGQRPVGAPVIQTFEKNSTWYPEALKGIEGPYPSSLRFLEDQANWYTPFSRPGMTDRYDIRGLHRR